MKQWIIVLSCFWSVTLLGQKDFKGHKFESEFIALHYFLDSIAPFHEEIKHRRLVSQGRIHPTSCGSLYHIIPYYKDFVFKYHKWYLEYGTIPKKTEFLYGGGRFCPRRHGLEKMRYNAYRKRAVQGESISRISISSMVYDEETNEKLVRVYVELKNDLINGEWYEVVFAILDGEIIYMKRNRDSLSNW